MKSLPTIELINDYIATHPKVVATAEEVYDYWYKKQWKTKKGVRVATLETAINVVNGIVANKRKKEKRTKGDVKQEKTFVKYEEQLKDSRWFAFRDFVFEVRGRRCEMCGSSSRLQIHHPKYKYGRKAWEYTCNEVMVLCAGCHSETHGLNHEENIVTILEDRAIDEARHTILCGTAIRKKSYVNETPFRFREELMSSGFRKDVDAEYNMDVYTHGSYDVIVGGKTIGISLEVRTNYYNVGLTWKFRNGGKVTKMYRPMDIDGMGSFKELASRFANSQLPLVPSEELNTETI